jgi:acyl carrier protein
VSVHEQLQRVFREVFGSNGIDDASSPETVDGWDSMGHLALVSELERVFAIRFSTTDIVEMVNVRCIKEILAERTAR